MDDYEDIEERNLDSNYYDIEYYEEVLIKPFQALSVAY